MVALAGSWLLAAGCSRWVDNRFADYHQWRAERAEAAGDTYKAQDQQRKAEKNRAKASSDPIP